MLANLRANFALQPTRHLSNFPLKFQLVEMLRQPSNNLKSWRIISGRHIGYVHMSSSATPNPKPSIVPDELFPQPLLQHDDYSLDKDDLFKARYRRTKPLSSTIRNIYSTRNQTESLSDFLSRHESSTATISTIGLGKLIQSYISLTKPRLSALVLLTTMSGYAMAPQTCSLPPALLISSCLGTMLCIASANTFNQLSEIEFDRSMTRTRLRALCRKKYPLSKRGAWYFGTFCGLSGGMILMTFVNPLTAALGVFNIGLYSGLYTTLKQSSIYNTQIGSLVGGIPPIMGYVAVTNSLSVDALLLGLILYSWQFPHFNALSYSIRREYQNAGYKMLSFLNPKRNAFETVAGSAGLVAGSIGMVYTGLVSECFLLGSSIVNGWMLLESMRFYQLFRTDASLLTNSKNNSDDIDSSSRDAAKEKAAKRLFHASLIHLPALILLMLIHKHWPRAEERKKRLDCVVHEPFGIATE